MEGLPTGDLQAKYQKLASEYSKLRVHVKVLKKGVLDEQAKGNEIRETLKEKEKALRKGELEIDSLTFRNQQLTRRVSVLQDELEALQLKLTKKSKSKGDEKQPSTSAPAPVDSSLLQEELQKKIIENAQYASQLSDKVFEISQLKATLDDYQRHLSENDSKYKCEIAKLRNKNQELQLALQDAQKERLIGTPSRAHLATGSQASCNGDLLSEGGSLLGSEDALSSVDELNVNEQLSVKVHTLEKENEKLRMEYSLMQMENDSLKVELSKHEVSKKRSEGHDSGDFNFHEASVDGEGKITGLLGSIQVPFLLSHEVQAREERIKNYFRNKISVLNVERDELRSKTEHYVKECEMLRVRFEEMEREKQTDEHTLQDKHNTISRLEDELHSTAHNYEEQMSVLTEHVAGLNDQLARQHDQIHHLKQQLAKRK